MISAKDQLSHVADCMTEEEAGEALVALGVEDGSPADAHDSLPSEREKKSYCGDSFLIGQWAWDNVGSQGTNRIGVALVRRLRNLLGAFLAKERPLAVVPVSRRDVAQLLVERFEDITKQRFKDWSAAEEIYQRTQHPEPFVIMAALRSCVVAEITKAVETLHWSPSYVRDLSQLHMDIHKAMA